jgi:formylglycine-generating enzyme required for sulfatase activity
LLVVVTILASLGTRAEAVTISWSKVGDPGNAADASGFGAVAYSYSIGTYDVTADQYAAFLNAVAASDPYGLWNPGMANGPTPCGINRSGNSGSYSYSVAPGHGSFPVNWVSWSNAARMANWLQNGQPNNLIVSGQSENANTTEDGAYTLNGATSNDALMAVTRNTGAKYFIPSEDEWYKAAFYKGGGTNAGYWRYATQSNTTPINTLPDTGNHANFYDYYGTGNGGFTDPVNLLTPVGSFNLSPGPYGTFDMDGELFQWNEGILNAQPQLPNSVRGIRGGAHNDPSDYLPSSYRDADYPSFSSDEYGFRLASVPEPSSIALVLVAALGLGVHLVYRSRRASRSPTDNE